VTNTEADAASSVTVTYLAADGAALSAAACGPLTDPIAAGDTASCSAVVNVADVTSGALASPLQLTAVAAGKVNAATVTTDPPATASLKLGKVGGAAAWGASSGTARASACRALRCCRMVVAQPVGVRAR
jgi:hypothetical protein